jgi:hypothetical protein
MAARVVEVVVPASPPGARPVMEAVSMAFAAPLRAALAEAQRSFAAALGEAIGVKRWER